MACGPFVGQVLCLLHPGPFLITPHLDSFGSLPNHLYRHARPGVGKPQPVTESTGFWVYFYGPRAKNILTFVKGL